jgi:hypothetical protein
MTADSDGRSAKAYRCVVVQRRRVEERLIRRHAKSSPVDRYVLRCSGQGCPLNHGFSIINSSTHPPASSEAILRVVLDAVKCPDLETMNFAILVTSCGEVWCILCFRCLKLHNTPWDTILIDRQLGTEILETY